MSIDEFGAQYDANVQKIYNFLYFRVRHKETAEDLTSITFAKAVQKLGSFNQSKGSFSTWLFTIARNTLFDYYRTHKPVEELELAENKQSKNSVESQFEAKNTLDSIEKFLQTLPNDQREIIMMRVWDDLSYKEIAQITGKSEGSCKMIVSRTLAKIKLQNV